MNNPDDALFLLNFDFSLSLQSTFIILWSWLFQSFN